ncbi:hypothetical protein H6501_04820 [Candidatus Woesearchaeota archaeon]|nr:hypothetical protein [Nanoarchaeota archaeon]MCB9370896.1 hypothetical protein [Candidatus Woesearchaeota archaeon]USN43997.1 MAG: hypothetical protein H6500_06425 [Candidatus Woesearchaeota archaeon]
MEEIEFESIWEKYGLSDTPYSTTPLRLLGPVRIEKLFANRTEITKILGDRILSNSTSRTLIIGNPGIGKTSFGNFLRWHLCRKDPENSKYLTTAIELKIQEEWNNQKFLRAVLSAVYNANLIFNWSKQGIKLKTLKDLKDYIKGSKSKSFSGQVGVEQANIAASYGETLTIPNEVSTEILEDFFMRLMKDIRQYKKGLILQLNNLENISNDTLANLLRNIRDYLQVEGLHTLFLGPPEALTGLEKYPQVHSVFGKTISLEALKKEEVLEVLEKRCEALKDPNGSYIYPYEKETVFTLYESLNQDLRLTFKVLDDTTTYYTKEAPCRITLKEVKLYSEDESKKQFGLISMPQRKIIAAFFDHGPSSPTQIREYTNLLPTNISRELNYLRNKGILNSKKSEEDKRVTTYNLSPNMRMILTFSNKNLKEFQ